MNPIDDLFRGGLGERPGDVPPEMWDRIRDGQAAGAPEGEALDKLFADGLKGATPAVPAGMWERIAGEGLPQPSPVDKIFADALTERAAAVPAGAWTSIWAARTSARRKPYYLAAAALLLLLLGGLAAVLFHNVDQFDPTLSDFPVAQQDVPTETERAEVAGVDAGAKVVVAEAGGEPPVVLAANARPTLAQSTAAADGPSAPQKVTGSDKTNTAAQETTELLAAEMLNNSDAFNARRLLNPTVSQLPVRELTAAVASLTEQDDDATFGDLPRVRRNRQPGVFRSAPRHRLQTELLFGVAYADQQLTARSTADLPLRELRNLSETAEVSYQVSLRGAYQLNDRLVFRGGLTYTEIRNQVEYGLTVNQTPTDIRASNHIRLLEAPLLLGYQVHGRRVHVSFNAGPVVNLTTGVRGRFLDPNFGEPRDLATAGNFRRHTGVGYMASLTTTYQIGKKEPFLLVLEPFFKSYPTAFTVKGAPLKEEYWLAGLQLGIRKGF